MVRVITLVLVLRHSIENCSMELESHLNLHGVKMASFSYDCISEYGQYSISRAPLKARMNDYLIFNISNTRDSVSSEYPITEKRVENATRSRVFLTKFEVF